MADLPDWYSQVVSEAVEASSIKGGADAAKAASPVSKDIYYATDTKILYICAADGTWTGIDAASLVEGILTLYANLAGGGYKLTNIGAPTAATDGARKSEVDTVDAKLDDVSHAEPTRAVDTIYQNSTKIRLVTVTAVCNVYSGSGTSVSGYSYIEGQCSSSTPPTDRVASGGVQTLLQGLADGINNVNGRTSIAFIVPPNYYYRVATVIATDGVTPTLVEWHEWDLH